jgi:hypothetical protein
MSGVVSFERKERPLNRYQISYLGVFLAVLESISIGFGTESRHFWMAARRQPSFLGMTALIMGRAQEGIVDYSAYARVLNTFVNDQGQVNYQALKNNPQDLDRFIGIIEQVDTSPLTPEQQKAFWINAYNALTLFVVKNHYPVNNIRLIDFGLVWQVRRKAARGKYSLGDIEHHILRPLKDPRIHFALNCASKGCPSLSQEPFDPQRLDEQLDREAREFINNPQKVRLDRSAGILYYSAIFKWYEEDFLKTAPDILSYLKRYLNAEDRDYLDSHSVTRKVLDYDWGLNKQ